MNRTSSLPTESKGGRWVVRGVATMAGIAGSLLVLAAARALRADGAMANDDALLPRGAAVPRRGGESGPLRATPGFDLDRLALWSAIALAGIDVVHLVKGGLSRVYLLDAVAEAALIGAWLAGRRTRLDGGGSRRPIAAPVVPPPDR